MLSRNASQARKNNKQKQKHTQRLKDIAQADVSFISNLEQNTNFMVPAGGRRKNKGQKPEHAPTILSQVKKYGIEEMYQFNQRFVRTRDDVTDDPADYLPRRSAYDHSHIYPQLDKEPGSKRSEDKTSKNIKISKLYHGSQTDINAGRAAQNASKKPEIEMQHKVLLNIASTSKLDEHQHKQSGNDLVFNQRGGMMKTPGAFAKMQTDCDYPDYPTASENKRRDSQPFTVVSGSEDPSHAVAMQIKEKAGSTEIRLNEDSDSSVDNRDVHATAGINTETDPAYKQLNSMHSNPSLVMGEQIAVSSKDKEMQSRQDDAQIQNQIKQRQQMQNRQKTNAAQPKRLSSNAKNPEFQKILDHVSSENKRLWRLYDNNLDNTTNGRTSGGAGNFEYSSFMNKRGRDGRQRKRESQDLRNSKELRSSESQERVAEFIKAVKNHTVYRRDNFVRNFTNQTKQSLEPYLRFQVKEPKDALKSRPLSSAIKRADGMYPSRDTVARANQTDGTPNQPNATFNSVRGQVRPGQTRPFSSHLNNLVLLKQDQQPQKRARQGMSLDRLARGRPHQGPGAANIKRSDVELRMTSSKADGGILSSSQLDSSDHALRQKLVQHQRLLSYQLSQQPAQEGDQAGPMRQRPVSSVPHHYHQYPANRQQYLSANTEHGREEEEETGGGLSSADPHGREDFINVRQMLDPSLIDSSHHQQPPLTGKLTMKQISDTTDMQSALLSNHMLAPAEILSEEDRQHGNQQKKLHYQNKALGRPRSTPYSHLQRQQATRASQDSKSSQNLISQLRIKSVRQSKVRIVRDASSKDHFDIVIDKRDQGERQSWLPSRHMTSRVKQQDKVISNATNLHRATDSTFQNTPVVLSSATSKINFGRTAAPTQKLSNSLERQQTEALDQQYLVNDFPEDNCEQLELEILRKYSTVEHMSDFLVYSETRSPIFIYNPKSAPASKVTRIFTRFKECLQAGQLDQAMTMLDLGMKWKQHLHAFKFNAGVTYLLSQQYLEAVQTFRLLSKSFPSSPSIHSNLLYAYLCDGWINNVKEFQSTQLFKSIKAPLTAQTKSILELIKYAFMSPDSIRFSKIKRAKSAADKFSAANVVQAKDLRRQGTDNNFDLRFNEQSDVLEAESEEDDSSSGGGQNPEQVELEFRNFKKYRRLKDFTQRTHLDPMNHLLREKLRQARHPERNYQVEPKYASAGRSKSQATMREPNYWELYQTMLEEYHRKDKAKQKEQMAHFQKVLDKIHKLCNDEEEFQTGPHPIKTHIVKTQVPPPDAAKVNTIRSSQKSRKHRSSQASVASSSAQAAVPDKNETVEERKRREGDVNRILRKVKKIEEEQLKKDMENDDEEGLDAIFKQLVSKRATYISESVEDPIELSYMQLIDGLGIFHERYNVRNFIDQYIEMLEQIKNSEQIQKLEEAAGGFWTIETDVKDQKLSRKELNEQFLEKFPVFDEQVSRARTFILDILFKLSDAEVEGMKKTFEDMAHYAEDRRRGLTMDSDRFAIEQPFILVTREFIKLQQELAQRMKLTKSVKVLEDLKGESQMNQDYVDLIMKAKDLTGRHEETVLVKTLEITKGDHQARATLAQQVSSPLNERNLGMSQLSEAKIREHQELYTRGWEKQTYRPLPKEEKLALIQKVSDEADDLLIKARIRLQQNAIEKLERQKKKSEAQQKTYFTMLERLREQKEIQVKREEERKQRERVTTMQKTIVKNLQVKAHVEAALHDTQQYEFDLINAKLNLDAIEIESKLAQCFSAEAGLWEETAALKVVKQKIESINETITNPQLLHDRDDAKLGPLQEKWFNATDQLINRAKKEKALGHLSSALQDELKDDMTQDESKKHLQIRPKIGHEVTDNQIGLIETSLKMWSEISHQERIALDLLLAKNNRFFSIFDQSTRLAMYAHCTVQHHMGKEKVIDRDVEETDNIQILLRGNIHIVQVNDELKIALRLASLRAGEVCGDQSIQRKIRDPLKVLSKERKTAVTNAEETITILIHKEYFMKALFAEMQQELFYKIILLRNTPYFQELSPYSLTIMASNVEVREVKYGEVIVQQGQIPDAMYILAYGQCKTLYQYVEQKSTKVSKYANKCLKSDLPKPIHTGLTNYKTMPRDIFDKVNKNELTEAQTNQEKEHSSDRKSKASGDNQNATAAAGNKSASKMQEALQSKLSKIENKMSKRSFYHSILQQDKKNMTIKFQNHLVYHELKVGQVFGMRALLDPLICKNHILEHRKHFAKKLAINLDALWGELLKKQQLTLDQPEFKKVKRKEANQKSRRFCNKCYEKNKPNCDCLLNQLPEGERLLADAEREKDEERKQQNLESTFCAEFNDSHDFDVSMKSGQQPVDGGILRQSPNRQSQKKKNKDLAVVDKLNLSPDEAYRQERDRVREQIEELTRVQESVEKVTKVKQHKMDHKDRLQKKVEEEFSGRFYHQLMQAQASIIVTSSSAKFLVIKKEDKSLLNEYLRVCIDRAILDTNFVDKDRPQDNQNDVQKAVQQRRGWTNLKEDFMAQIMKESKMSKKANKLLDD